jgi:glycosyltransferase involved in cell wall biosynthesis
MITCVAKPMAAYIEQVSGGKKPTVIYNAIPASMVPESANPITHKPEKLKILYVGNMGFCQNLSLVLDAAKILQNRSETEIEFHIVGNGIEKSMLEKRILDEGIKNVKISGVIPKSEAINLIRTTEALMLHLKDDGTMDKTIPSKVFDYMAGGRPILFGLKGEACEILGSIGGNLYYDPADATQLADQAMNLKLNYAELAQKAQENLVRVKNEFLRERMVDRLEKAFFDNQ